MTAATHRFLLRLRQRAVRCYELLLYALLLALAFGAALAGTPAGGDEPQCGNIHSNAPVIAR